jgi:TP901 family phage tail tape measure protein
MARVELNIVALGDFKNVNSQISALKAQVDSLNKSLAGTGLKSSLIKDLNAAQSAFKATMLSTGQFTEQTVKLKSETDKFGEALVGGKLKLNEYFNIIRSRSSQATAQMRALAIEQTKLQNSLITSDPTKQGVFSVFTPARINEASNATKIATNMQNLYNIAVNKGTQSLINWGKNTQWAGRQLTVGLTVPMTMFGAASMKTFQEINDQLVRLQKVYGSGLTQPTSEALAKVKTETIGLAKELASSWGVAAKDTASMAADIAATGKTGTDLIVATREAMRLSKLGELDTQQAMQATVSLQNVYKISTQELGGAVNFLNAVENQTSTSLQDLVDGIPRVGPIVAQLGGSFKDTAVMMVAMKEAGIPAAQSANAIKSALASLINPSKAATEAFSKYNINLSGMATATKGNPVQMIMMLQKSLQGLEPLAKAQLIEKLFGKFQQARVSALIENLGSLNSQTKTAFDLVNASAPQLASIAAKELSTATESTTGKFKRAVETIKADLIPVGEKVMQIATVLLKFGDAVGKTFGSLPSPVKSLFGLLAGGVALSGPLIMLTGVMANFVGYLLRGMFGIKSLITGTKTLGELLTPNLIASQQAAQLFSSEIVNDIDAVNLMNQAVKQLTATLEGLSGAMQVGTGDVATQVAATIAASGIPALPTRKGIQSVVTKEEAAAWYGSGQTTGTHTTQNPTSGAYVDRAIGEEINGPLAKGGIEAKKYIVAMTTLTGETEKASTMFRTTYSDYFAAITKLPTVAGKQLITEENANKILSEINNQYQAELLEMQRMYELTGEQKYLLTDINNPLAQIAQKVIRMNAELSANPELFTQMFDEFNVASSKNRRLGAGQSGGGNKIGINAAEFGTTSLTLGGNASERSMLLHSYNEEFLAFKDKFISDMRVAAQEAGIVLDETFLIEVEKTLENVNIAMNKSGTINGESYVASFQQQLNKSLGIGMEQSAIKSAELSADVFMESGILDGKAYVAGFESTVTSGIIAAESKGALSGGVKNKNRMGGLIGGKLGMGMMAGSMALSMVGGDNKIAQAANSSLMAGSMAAMMTANPYLIATAALLPVVTKGIGALMEKEKEHAATAKATFSKSQEAVDIFGNATTSIYEKVDALNSSDPSSGLKRVANLIKTMNSESSITGTLKSFSSAQVMAGMDPSKVKEMTQVILSYAGKSQYLASVQKEVSSATKDLTTAISTNLSKLKQASNQSSGSAIQTAYSYKELTNSQKQYADGMLQVFTAAASSTTPLSTMMANLNALTSSTNNATEAFKALELAATQAGNTALASKFSQFEGLGYTPDDLAMLERIGKSTLPNLVLDQKKYFDSQLTKSNLVKSLYDQQNISGQEQNLGLQKQALSIKDHIKLLEKKKKIIDDQIKAEEKITAEKKRQRDFEMKQFDLQNQVKEAQIKGNYLQAANLKQQMANNTMTFNEEGRVSPKQKISESLANEIAKLQEKGNNTSDKMSKLSLDSAAKNLSLSKSGIDKLVSNYLAEKKSSKLDDLYTKPLPVILAGAGQMTEPKTSSSGLNLKKASQEAIARKSGLTSTNSGGSVYVFKWNNQDYAVSGDGIIQKWNAQKFDVTGKPLTGKASGGLISGPGTGTSDSIPARIGFANGGMLSVSNGEYIQKAAAVQKYGVNFMDSINAGRYNPESSTSNSNTVYNIDMTINGGNANANDIANQVISKLKVIGNKSNKSNMVVK